MARRAWPEDGLPPRLVRTPGSTRTTSEHLGYLLCAGIPDVPGGHWNTDGDLTWQILIMPSGILAQRPALL